LLRWLISADAPVAEIAVVGVRFAILAAWGASTERFGGQSTDDEAQQAYFHARQFQSRTGRFGTVDPVFAADGDPQRLNRYSYSLGNPLRNSDVLGADPSNVFNPCVDSSSPDCLSDDPFWPGFGGGNDVMCPLSHGGLCGEPPQKPGHPRTKPDPPTDPTPTDPHNPCQATGGIDPLAPLILTPSSSLVVVL
jgi:RHS repeat-associated protein